jgi:hypothetical protein
MTGLVKLASVSLEGKTVSFTPMPAGGWFGADKRLVGPLRFARLWHDQRSSPSSARLRCRSAG